jgi:hypothetical protein
MTVAWPTVKDRLVALLPTLPGFAGVLVFDGPAVTGEAPAAYVTVGWQESTDDDTAGSYEQTQTGPEGFAAEETGTVLLEFAAVTGDVTVPSAFGLVDALQNSVQTDQTLGVLGRGSTASLAVEVVQSQTTSGAVQRLLVSLTYFARL